ncbi:MAG TPA: TonB-dependent receptor plug domain-containing protein, partial [Puia sp.]|nr:TonB-dependent receptor plug domain-containing protein [Puia sp.]
MQLTAFNKKACLSLLIIGLTLTAVQPLGAQTTAARITLSEKHVSLKYIFNRISKMAGISILYDEKAIANITVANINVTSVSLQQAMQECLKGTNLDFEIKSNSIVVRKKESVSASVVQQPNDFFISGKVMDESGTPLAGVSIYVRGTDMALSTVEGGLFSMNGVPGTGIIVFSSIGYQTLELPYDHNPEFNVRLKKKVTQLAEVAVEVNNGYQVIPKERTTGSFDVIDNKLFNRSVSSNLLDHLDGVASGVLFDNRGNDPNGSLTFRGNTQTFYIRGVATVQSSNAPLVVVDGFPYNGYAPYQQNINNLNPNDIESVTILKDAAAASIWGARAGNGVVVITTKSGKYNQRPQVNFNSSVTFTGKPLLFTQRILSTSDFIDIEKNLYPQGAYDNVFDPTQNQGRPPTQVIQLLHDVDQGLITQAEADAQIAALSKTDVRHDALKYFYRTGIDQQYNLSVSGGSPASKYFLDGGYDHLTAPDYSFQDRYSLNSNYTFKPADGLELSFPLQFTINQTGTNNGSWSSYGLAPYTKLTDATGHPINVNFTNGYNQDFIQKADALGLYDMSYNPIEQFHAAQYQHTNSLLASIGPDIRYSLHNGLNFDLKYQYSRTIRQGRTYQSDSLFNIKNMINNYTQIDPTGGLSFPINRGGTLQTDNYDETDNNIRATVGYNRLLGNYHRINIIAGYEHNESKIIRDYNGWYGYNPRTGTVQTTVDYISYFPQLNNTLSGSPYSFSSPVYPLQSGTTTSFLAYISSFANASYTFKERYVLTASGRIDQANLFGV